MKPYGWWKRRERREEAEALEDLSVNELTCTPSGFLWRLYESALNSALQKTKGSRIRQVFNAEGGRARDQVCDYLRKSSHELSQSGQNPLSSCAGCLLWRWGAGDSFFFFFSLKHEAKNTLDHQNSSWNDLLLTTEQNKRVECSDESVCEEDSRACVEVYCVGWTSGRRGRWMQIFRFVPFFFFSSQCSCYHLCRSACLHVNENWKRVKICGANPLHTHIWQNVAPKRNWRVVLGMCVIKAKLQRVGRDLKNFAASCRQVLKLQLIRQPCLTMQEGRLEAESAWKHRLSAPKKQEPPRLTCAECRLSADFPPVCMHVWSCLPALEGSRITVS